MEYLRIPGKKTYIFGTWNVRGINDPNKINWILSEIERENVDLAVLSGTLLDLSGQKNLGKYTHIYNGHSGKSGVSIVVKNNLGEIKRLQEIEEEGEKRGKTSKKKKRGKAKVKPAEREEEEPAYERIITANLKIKERELIIIGVYWNTDQCKDKDKKTKTITYFEDTLEKYRDDELIILGDFNAWVGNSKILENYEKVVGRFGDNKVNGNGRKLISVCETYKLTIQNTFFDHEDIHKFTFHRNGETTTQIDFFITKQTDPHATKTLLVHDVLACRWLDCRTDHIFLAATISIPTEQPQTNKENVPKMRRYKIYLLHSKTFRDSYNKHLDSVINTETGLSTKDMYNHLNKSIHLAAYDELGVQDKDASGELVWDKEIKDLRAKRGLPDRTSFDSHFGKIQNEVWEGICSTIDKAKRNKRSKIVRDILDEVVNKTNENVIHQQPSEKFCQSLFEKNRISVKKFEPKKEEEMVNRDEIDPEQIVHISIDNVTKALDELDDDKWPVPDGLSVQLLRNSSHKTKLLLANLIQGIFNYKDLPPEIGETYISIKNYEKYSIQDGLQVHCIMRVLCFLLNEILEKTVLKNNSPIVRQLTPSDVTFTLRLLLQKNAEEKKPTLHFVFVDLKQTYFGVEYSKLFRILKKHFSSPISQEEKKFLSVLEYVLTSNTIRVVAGNELSKKKFTLSKGLIEQCNLGPTLLKMYIQESIKELDNRDLSYIISNDKLIIVAPITLDLETKVLNLKEKEGLHINLEDLEYLRKEEEKSKEGLCFKKHNIEIKRKDIINLHGFFFELDRKCLKGVSKRILEARNAIGYLHPVLRDERISNENKSRIFNTVIRSILMNGCEKWALNADIEKSITSLEESYWKWCTPKISPIISAKFILRDDKGCSKEMKLDEGPVWLLNWNPNETGSIGSLINKWVDDIEEIRKDEAESKKRLELFTSE